MRSLTPPVRCALNAAACVLSYAQQHAGRRSLAVCLNYAPAVRRTFDRFLAGHKADVGRVRVDTREVQLPGNPTGVANQQPALARGNREDMRPLGIPEYPAGPPLPTLFPAWY